MYADTKPCAVCGSPVRLEGRDPADPEPDTGPVGPSDGYVGTADGPVDDRVCTNDACPTHDSGPDSPVA